MSRGISGLPLTTSAYDFQDIEEMGDDVINETNFDVDTDRNNDNSKAARNNSDIKNKRHIFGPSPRNASSKFGKKVKYTRSPAWHL